MKLISLLILAVVLAASANGMAVDFVENINEFREENPGVKLIKLDFVDHELDTSRSYSLGGRQTGDTVVANASNKKSWPVAQNVTTTLSYPSSGTNGAFLTFILINCEQSSNIGQAYVAYGGVGQHFIQIIIETKITTYFNYAAFFYGIK